MGGGFVFGVVVRGERRDGILLLVHPGTGLVKSASKLISIIYDGGAVWGNLMFLLLVVVLVDDTGEQPV